MPNGQTRPPGPILGACNRMIAVVFVTIAEATLDVSCSVHCCLVLSPLLPSWMFLACPFIVFFLILSPLLPSWMWRARAIVVLCLVSLAPTVDVSCSSHCCPSLILSPLLPSRMCLARRFVVSPSSCHHCTALVPPWVAASLLLPPWSVLAARGLASLILSPWLLPPWSFLASAVADPHLVIIAPSSCHHYHSCSC